jgi:hypothetical protein
MTSAPVREPLADHLLAPQNAALLFIGYQPAPLPGSARWTARCWSRTPFRRSRPSKPFGSRWCARPSTSPPAGTANPPRPRRPSINWTTSRPAGGSGHRREVATLPQAGDQLPVLGRLRQRGEAVRDGSHAHCWSSLMPVPPEPRIPGNWPDHRIRPKLQAIKMSGCHPIPVILRASSRGRQARMGGQARVM